MACLSKNDQNGHSLAEEPIVRLILDRPAVLRLDRKETYASWH